MGKNIKEDVIEVLQPIFGERVKKTIEQFYDEKDPGDSKELIIMAHTMLEGYMGEKQADIILSNIKKKYAHA